jgi:hypothetical protein
MALGIIKSPGNLGNGQNYPFGAPGFVVGSRPRWPQKPKHRLKAAERQTSRGFRIITAYARDGLARTQPSTSHRPKGVSHSPEDIVDYPNAWVN